MVYGFWDSSLWVRMKVPCRRQRIGKQTKRLLKIASGRITVDERRMTMLIRKFYETPGKFRLFLVTGYGLGICRDQYIGI